MSKNLGVTFTQVWLITYSGKIRYLETFRRLILCTAHCWSDQLLLMNDGLVAVWVNDCDC